MEIQRKGSWSFIVRFTGRTIVTETQAAIPNHPTPANPGWHGRMQHWSASGCWGSTRTSGTLQRLISTMYTTFSHGSRAQGWRQSGHREDTSPNRIKSVFLFFATKQRSRRPEQCSRPVRHLIKNNRIYSYQFDGDFTLNNRVHSQIRLGREIIHQIYEESGDKAAQKPNENSLENELKNREILNERIQDCT